MKTLFVFMLLVLGAQSGWAQSLSARGNAGSPETAKMNNSLSVLKSQVEGNRSVLQTANQSLNTLQITLNDLNTQITNLTQMVVTYVTFKPGTCPEGQEMRGISNDGAPVCRQKPCAPGEVQKVVDGVTKCVSEGCAPVKQASALQFEAVMATAYYGDWWGNGGQAWESFPGGWGVAKVAQDLPQGKEGETLMVAASRLSSPGCASANGVWNACSAWCATTAFNVQIECEAGTKRWRLPKKIQFYQGPRSHSCTALASTTPVMIVDDEFAFRQSNYSYISPWGKAAYISPP